MYDINLKNIKKWRRYYLIVLASGILLFIFLCYIFTSEHPNMKLTKPIDMKVLSVMNGDTEIYVPIYTYEVQSQKYTCASDKPEFTYPKTEGIMIYYNSKTPTECEIMTKFYYIYLFVLIFPSVVILIGIINITKANKKLRIIKYLNTNGKLVKNLVYHLENTGTSINDVPIKRPVIDYKLASGNVLTLYGDPRYDRKLFDEDGRIDLLIDEANPENYFMDYEINRLSGNLKDDYYEEPSDIK